MRRAPSRVATGTPQRLPEQVPQRRLERPVAPGVKRDRLQRPRVPGDGERVPAHEQMPKLSSKPAIVSPLPIPVRPASVSTRTIVASNVRRGTGSQAA